MALWLKALALWLLLAAVAIGNGLLRQKILLPLLGNQAALPLSGVSLSVLILLVTFLALPLIGRASRTTYWSIGGVWVLLTLAFEFGFGHYVAGKPLADIIQLFNIKRGDLFPLVLCVTAAAPYAGARLRGYL